MKELKCYTINGHTITLSLDNVCSTPFFVVRSDRKETFAGKSRLDAIDAFDAACRKASEEVANG